MLCPHCGKETTEKPKADLSPLGQNNAAAQPAMTYVFKADTAAACAAPPKFIMFNTNAGAA